LRGRLRVNGYGLIAREQTSRFTGGSDYMNLYDSCDILELKF